MSEAEIIEKMIAENIVVPGEYFFVKPTAFLYHDDHISRQDNCCNRVFPDCVRDLSEPMLLARWLYVGTDCPADGPNDECTEDQ